MSNYSVLIQDAVKSYGSKEVLKKLCMKVEKGQIYGLLGASGCGKTTLLSAIVGRKKIESGEIWVLGEKQEEKGSNVPGWKVGYMPQEVALAQEFTVKDAVFYFGRIYFMKEKIIEKRYRELSDLLNLPPDDRYIKNCSGGQQRRVSLAVALIHKPQLLILDEPTVGIDPILREKIWSYLVQISKQESMSVIITTHYIEECRQADRIGLMREGRLLAEESPNRLLQIFNKETLEEVFLILSKKQDEGKLDLSDLTDPASSTGLEKVPSIVTVASPSQSIPDGYKSTDELTEHQKPGSNVMSQKRMRALFDKNSKQFYRNPTAVIFLLAMPIVQILMMLYAVGLDVKDIPLGIVNDESMSAFCPGFSKNETVQTEEKLTDCHLQNMSCRFLQYLDNHPMITKVQYDNINEAYHAAIHGEVTGVMYIPKNFSESFEERLNDGWTAEGSLIQFSQIKVRLDMSNQQIGVSIKNKLTQLYIDFQKELFQDCKYLARAGDLPVHTEFVYGEKDEPYQVFVIPGAIITMIFFFGSIMTSTIMITEKYEGIWDRSIVAGVTSTELTVSHLSFQGFIAIFQTLEMILTIFFVYEYQYVGSFWLIYLIAYFQGLCGMSYGMFISIVSTNQIMSNNAVMGFFLPTIMISGSIWPVEGMPKILQYVSRVMPCTLPVQALNVVLKKGLTLADGQVLGGILVSIAWILIFGLLGVFFLKRQR